MIAIIIIFFLVESAYYAFTYKTLRHYFHPGVRALSVIVKLSAIFTKDLLKL